MDEKLRLLIVDDDRRMVKTLVDILSVKGYEVEPAYSGSEALQKVEEGSFGCVLSDIRMPEIDGVELYKKIKARRPGLPMVLMTAYATDQRVQEGLTEGAVAVLTKPFDIGNLLNFFSFLHKERLIVIVDDDENFCKTLGDVLQIRGFKVTGITDPHAVMKKLKKMKTAPGVVLLDMKLNGIDGLQVLKEIRRRYANLPVVLVTGYKKEKAGAIETALEIKAHTCLYKPLEIETLVDLLTEICNKELKKSLKQ